MTNSRQSVPHRAHAFAMWLFLASLSVLFAASMVGYVVIRLSSPAMSRMDGRLELPAVLWLSTALVLAASVTIHLALQAIQHERQQAFRRFLIATLALAVAFVLVQIPALIGMLQSHGSLREQGVHLYALVFCLVLLHAAHVVGGVIALAIIVSKALKGRYDHEHHMGVHHAALYWHFLDAVWLVMFGTMMALG